MSEENMTSVDSTTPNTVGEGISAEGAVPNAVGEGIAEKNEKKQGQGFSLIPEQYKFVTSSTLKWIAIITMFIDHVTAVLFEQAPWFDPDNVGHILLDALLRGIGRIAFPIFIFMMVEGLFYTHSRWKYLLRMGIFAMISDIPFDMAAFLTNQQIINEHKIENWATTSVFATLFLGLLAMTLMELIREKLKMESLPKAVRVILKLLICLPIALGTMVIAEILGTDYGAGGVAGILVCYVATLLLRKWYTTRFTATVFSLTVVCNVFEIAAIFAFPVFLFYNGKKGKNINKWFFYFFYPCHLLILAIIRILIYGA
ncbi:MAG: conjugal transfer protein TraX [Lachnospiraceae bacterium]|nr:conjugal transfer protein TraX [Lachnospiraceae bacterium]